VAFVLTVEEARRIKEKVKADTKAAAEARKPTKKVTVRDLRPQDLNYSNPDWTHTWSAAGWETLVSSYTIPDNTYIGIYGVYVNNSAVTAIKIAVGGADKRYWDVQDIADREEKFAVLEEDETIIFAQGSTVTIQAYANAAGDYVIKFLGYVAEPYGKLVYKE